MKKADAILITSRVLRGLGLPRPSEDADKEGRGRVLIVGGSREMPGALALAGEAALRAGAGKLRIATVESVATHVALSMPEARVYSLPETKGGDIAHAASKKLSELIDDVDAVCIGPGMIDEGAATRLLRRLLAETTGASLVLDANAISCLTKGVKLPQGIEGRVVITPHAEEMAGLLGVGREEIESAPAEFARRAAEEFRVVVALKGRETFVAQAGAKDLYRNRAGNVGLATSGSGDVLAGLIAGLLARGAKPLTAAVWGVHTHALAGDRLARSVGPLGFITRELLRELPSILARLEKVGQASTPVPALR